MLVLWFVLGVLCGSFFSIILMAMLFMAKEADENAQVPMESLKKKLVPKDTVRAA